MGTDTFESGLCIDSFEDKKDENELRLLLKVETKNSCEVLSTHHEHDADVHDHEPESSEVSKTDLVTRKPLRKHWKCELCEIPSPWATPLTMYMM